MARYHLLVFHALDVAACGKELLALPRFGAARIADELGWSEEQLAQVFVTLLALHDVGKFSRHFQKLAELGEPMVPVTPPLPREYERHDTMGWTLLDSWFRDGLLPGLTAGGDTDEIWAQWLQLIGGHHGRPPKQDGPDVKNLFLAADRDAAKAFLRDVFELLGMGELPAVSPNARAAMRRVSWRLAGLATLADWIGSNAAWFPPREQPEALAVYWQATQKNAEKAVRLAGFQESKVQGSSSPHSLLPFLEHSPLTPLQQYALREELRPGPQFFLLEDVTGSGKTEAALLLAHRLMAAGFADGLYFGLPTMATADQLYERVGEVYPRLYEPGERPSLILGHGASRLVEGFRNSIVDLVDRPEEQAPHDAGAQEPPSSRAQCSAWLADSGKKALLADVGVGTVDQALLGVLPVRHQSLRLLGLARKVLIVDEVHAYDTYTGDLLQRLVEAHTMAGGSTVLLSATVPAKLRADLLRGYRLGLGETRVAAVPGDERYPLATHAYPGGGVDAASFDTRPDLVRTVRAEALHDEAAALDWVEAQARAGRAVCWVRNTVGDAVRAFEELSGRLSESQVRLFHARFAMGHRLVIQNDVLRRFGKHSGAAQRRGQVLIATQVVEQSLDLDFDEMLSDLAPVDLLIQRAGRLHRHLRAADGDRRAPGERDGRADPVLHLLTPPRTSEPKTDWYSALFPDAQYVYDHPGVLWLTLEALLEAGQIASPGREGEPGGVRALIEAVYDGKREVPESLLPASDKAHGKQMVGRSQSRFNQLRLDLGYCDESSNRWCEKTELPTRLTEDTETVYLARENNGRLMPLLPGGDFPWQMSSLSVPVRRLEKLAPEWGARFGAQIEELQTRVRLFSDREKFVLPMVPDGEGWMARGWVRDKPVTVRYTERFGFRTEQE